MKIADVEVAFQENPLLKIAASKGGKSSRTPMKSPAVHDLLANSCIPEMHLHGKGSASFYPLVGLANGRYREQLAEFKPNEVGTSSSALPFLFVLLLVASLNWHLLES